MKTIFALASALALSTSTFAADVPDGAALAQTVCAACHGPDGNSFNGEWPKLAGQHPAYLAAQLVAYRCAATGAPKGCVPRSSANSALMIGQAAGLSDAQIASLAEHYSKQAIEPGVAPAALAAAGQKLYRGGNAQSGIAACIACHGPAGRGNAAAKYPAVGGQHAAYLEAQLKAYRDGSRRGDPNQMMRNVAANLTDDEIRAVAAYLQGLR
jgi:cytochrome c553